MPGFRRPNAWTLFWTLVVAGLVLLESDEIAEYTNSVNSFEEFVGLGLLALAVGVLLYELRGRSRRAAAALAAGRDTLADLMQSVPVGLALWAADGTLTAYNPAFLRHRSFPEKVGRGLIYRDFVANYVAKAGLTGDEAKAYIDRRLAAFAAVDGKPHEIAKLDGSVEEVRFYRARSGGVVGVYRDVTELKRRGAEIERQRAEFSEILETLPDGLMLWDPNGRLTAFNQAAVGIRADFQPALMGTHFDDFARAGVRSGKLLDALGREEEFLAAVLAEHANPTGAPREVARADGRWDEIRKFKTKSGGVVTIYRDITLRKRVETELARERERSADILAAISDGIVLWDSDNRLVAVNAAAARMPLIGGVAEIGIDYAEFARRSLEKNPVDEAEGRELPTLEERLANHANPTGAPQEFRYRDGTWMEMRKFRARDGGVVAVYRDVTRRKQAETELALQRGRLADILAAIPVGLAMWEADGALSAFNDEFVRLRNFPQTIVPGLRFPDFVAAFIARTGKSGAEAEAYMRERLTAFAAADGKPVRVVKRNGSIEEVSFHRARQGGVAGVYRDVTELARHQTELERQRRLLQDIMDALPDGLQLWGPDGKLALFNRTAERQRRDFEPLRIGVDIEAYNRRAIAKGAIPEALGREEEYLARRVAQHWNPALGSIEVLRGDGTWEEMRKVAMSDGSRLAIFRDISDRKRHEIEIRSQRDELARRLEERERLTAERDSAEAASRAKTEFLAMMSHELRTPMNGVIATTGLLARTRLADEQRLYLDTVQRSAQSLLTIIDDVLDWAKLEEGKIEIEAVDCAPAQIADNVVSLLRPAADQKGIELALDLDPALPEFGRLDPARLRQILLNLVGNAVKFTAEGRVRVRLRAEPRGDEGFMLSLEVEDSGIGIAPESVPKLFDRFTQADGSISRRFGGTGLGLAIVKRLLDLMGGSIDVSSRPGEGSRFVVRLPMASGKRPEHVAAPLLPAPARALKLLVAEDNAINRMVVEHLLRELGHAAEFARDGAEAVTKARAGDYDAILMDVQMPDTDGVQATKLIRALDGPRARVPIVALTANAMVGDRERYLEAGMDDYVSKPIDAYDLAAALARITGASVRDPAHGAARKPAAPLSHAAGRAALAGLVDALKRNSTNSD